MDMSLNTHMRGMSMDPLCLLNTHMRGDVPWTTVFIKCSYRYMIKKQNKTCIHKIHEFMNVRICQNIMELLHLRCRCPSWHVAYGAMLSNYIYCRLLEALVWTVYVTRLYLLRRNPLDPLSSFLHILSVASCGDCFQCLLLCPVDAALDRLLVCNLLQTWSLTCSTRLRLERHPDVASCVRMLICCPLVGAGWTVYVPRLYSPAAGVAPDPLSSFLNARPWLLRRNRRVINAFICWPLLAHLYGLRCYRLYLLRGMSLDLSLFLNAILMLRQPWRTTNNYMEDVLRLSSSVKRYFLFLFFLGRSITTWRGQREFGLAAHRT
jgi:hypothetical protein